MLLKNVYQSENKKIFLLKIVDLLHFYSKI